MKKWFDYQQTHQVTDFDWSKNTAPVMNLYPQLGKLMAKIKQNHAAKKYQVTTKKFFSDLLYQDAAAYGLGLSVDIMRDYMNDPEYEELLAGEATDCFMPNAEANEEEFLKKFFAKKLGMVKDKMVLSVRLQKPGQYFVLHFDRPKQQEWGTDLEDKTYLIFFDDWKMGQFFQLGTEFIKWRAGDVYTWSNKDVPHASANVGFDPRFLFLIYGKVNQNT
jgi:hypothetical protein